MCVRTAGRALSALGLALAEYFAPLPGFQAWSVMFSGRRARLSGAYNARRPRRWRNWSTRWPQKPLSFGTCGFESHPPHQTVDYGRGASVRAAMTTADGEDDRHAHRRRRLPRPECGHPGRRAQRGRRGLGLRRRARGLAGHRRGRFQDLGVQEVSGILPRGGTIIGTSRTNPYKLDGGVDKVLQSFRDRGLDALVAIGGEDTLGVRREALRRVRPPRRRSPEDDRQRPLRHRLHVRLRHGGDDRDRGDRPAAHDCRVAQPRHGRRGDGTPRGLDRRHERHRRRRRRHPHSGAAGRLRRGQPSRSASVTRAGRTSPSSSSARDASCRACRTAASSTSSGT